MHAYLDFERPIAELEGKIVELRKLAEADPTMEIEDDVGPPASQGERPHQRHLRQAHALAEGDGRAPSRASAFLRLCRRDLIDDFTPLAGDRLFGEDRAIIAGLGRFRGRAVAVIGHEKGNDTKTRLKHNFGMAMPEGYRKARRIFELADRFDIPVISFADTQGAYPGVGAEERGQAEAIARSTQAGLNLGVPFIATIIGEGMSGGALGIAVANRSTCSNIRSMR